MPGRGIAITHAQPEAHWQITKFGRCINLESMWDDFETSVDRLVDVLSHDESRRRRTLDYFGRTHWTVQTFQIDVPTARVIRPVGGSQVITPPVVASSASAMTTHIETSQPR